MQTPENLGNIPIKNSSIISSRLNEINQTFEINQNIAFIHNKLDLVSGYITSINPDGETYDLVVFIPRESIALKWSKNNESFKRKKTMQLIEEVRLKARVCDPRVQFRKVDIPLEQPMQVSNGQGLSSQVDIRRFIPLTDKNGNPRLTRIPRLSEFHTNIVGNFFDPQLFYYKIRCFRNEREINKVKFPTETLIFPTSKPFFKTYDKCFARYFKEYHQSRGKWDQVEVLAVHPEDV